MDGLDAHELAPRGLSLPENQLDAGRAGDCVGWSNPQRTDVMQFINSVRNKITKLLVGEVPAGACIPEVGMCCGRIPGLTLNCQGKCYLDVRCRLE
jgi:hypothetical protein